MFTKEGPAKEDDSYMGYSVATGDFVGNGDSGTAVGVPRGSDLLGKVRRSVVLHCRLKYKVRNDDGNVERKEQEIFKKIAILKY